MAERIKCVKRKKENVEKYTYAFTQKVGYGNIRKKYKISWIQSTEIVMNYSWKHEYDKLFENAWMEI